MRVPQLIIIAFLFSACSGNKLNEQDCKRFHTGKFEYFYDTVRIEVLRSNDMQVENGSMGLLKYKVHWTSPCEYELNFQDVELKLKNKSTVKRYKVKITQIEGNTYSYFCVVPGKARKFEGKITKIN